MNSETAHAITIIAFIIAVVVLVITFSSCDAQTEQVCIPKENCFTKTDNYTTSICIQSDSPEWKEWIRENERFKP